ncbi:hypothetical protein N0V83_001646 [Neocucurbitaria cava]|uniref:Uncharacterized protein n=1 Tax=Neocucurbitaria cava TaxID=798079 RepID=A0A9W8YFM3_9PLEO|nr:hypothetical protein N0V83_001646 [Neocucurbitaria cava]
MASFNELPAELRNTLYAELLMESRSLYLRQPVSNEFALFTVSKQLHHESSSYFYQNNDIAVDALSDATDDATILPPITDKYLPFLRRLTVHALTGQATAPSVRKVAKLIASLAAIGAEFEELDIWIMSPLSHLLNSRVDDSVMDVGHPIAVALRHVLASGVVRKTRIHLKNAWFATGVAKALHSEHGSRLEFFTSDTYIITDVSSLERPLTGRYSSTHLSDLTLSQEDIASCSTRASSISSSSTPSSLPSSSASAFADLDTFSVSSFHLNASDSAEKDSGSESDSDSDSSDGCDNDAPAQPFFMDDDIEQWQASATQEASQEEVSGDADADEDEEDSGSDGGDDDDDDNGDEEMEDVAPEEFEAFVDNLEEMAHHVANEEDVTYMTNFAPEMLLARWHLGHLA